ncbi:hypothetical protein [Shewanella oncorhynchi]|uniref:hypothetical protein n=1 Tax=Shewanella oncorhynchi TaxID=2726434 RepID=UPI003D7BBFB8
MTKDELRIKVEASLLQQLYKNYLTNNFDVHKRFDIGQGPKLDFRTLINDIKLTDADFHLSSDLLSVLVDMQCESLIEDLSYLDKPNAVFGITINPNDKAELISITAFRIEATGIIKNLRKKLDLN